MSIMDYMAENNIKDFAGLAAFVEKFLEDPGVLYTLSPDEMTAMEGRIDAALDLFRGSAS